jgi:hypothetical protein
MIMTEVEIFSLFSKVGGLWLIDKLISSNRTGGVMDRVVVLGAVDGTFNP